jgi:hypothetical protein
MVPPERECDSDTDSPLMCRYLSGSHRGGGTHQHLQEKLKQQKMASYDPGSHRRKGHLPLGGMTVMATST